MKIFLVYSVLGFPGWEGQIYNAGLGYIYAVLKKAHHDVRYFPLTNEEDVILLYKEAKADQPDIIGFSATTNQFGYLKEIIKTVKEISKSFILSGGIHPTLKPECIFEAPQLDAVVRGEGEFAMLELAEALANKRDYREIKNFWFREKDRDRVIKNEIRPLIENLDLLPFPDKSCLDNQRRINVDRDAGSFVFTRGCAFQCSYCSNKALKDLYQGKGAYIRHRGPEKAIEEVLLTLEKYRPSYIRFDDDTISLDKQWFYEFFTLYKEKLKYPFRCNLRVGTVNADMAKLLKEAGATSALLGVEHGNEEFRKNILKRYMTNKEIKDTFTELAQNGIPCHAQVMVGLPFENEGLFLDTVKLCRKLSLRGNHIVSIFSPYPGTELGEICEKNNWLPAKNHYIERRQAVIDYPAFTKERIQLCYDVFPFLVRSNFIPLSIPLGWAMRLFRFYNFMANLRLRIGLRTRLKLLLSSMKKV